MGGYRDIGMAVAALGIFNFFGPAAQAQESTTMATMFNQVPIVNVIMRVGFGLLGGSEAHDGYTAYRQDEAATQVGPVTDRDSALFAGD